MKSRSAKINILICARQCAMAAGLALMLMASPQVWAGVACFCEPQMECEDHCCQTAHHSETVVEMQSVSSTLETSTSCETATDARGVAQVRFQSPPVSGRCVMQPLSEPPARYVYAQLQVHAAITQPPDDLRWFLKPAFAHTFNHTCWCSKRPLYLAFSRLLI